MTPERWQQITTVFHAALESDAASLGAFLDKACADDGELRAEVDAMLKAHRDAGSFGDALDASLPVSVGSTVGSYEILAHVGAGGMGDVWRARDTKLKRDVALKILRPDLAASPDMISRFAREAKTTCNLVHSNGGGMLGSGESDGLHSIAMEYLDSQTLQSRIGNRPLETSEILSIATQVADALDAAHALGIVHRDVKPSNVMILPRGQVKVLDFGIARVVRSEQAFSADTIKTTGVGVVIGTVHYMSPEQALGQDVDHRSDIYSLGAVLYEMTTGKLPFIGDTPTATIDRIVHSQPESIARLNYDASEDLVRIIRKCLEKNRDRRYQSVRELLVDLHNLKRDSDVQQFVVSENQPVPTPARRRLATRRALAIPPALVALFVVSMVWFFQRKPALAFASRDWILITTFDNRTGDPVFDNSLDTAFSVSIEQSQYANVFPRSRIDAALKRMKKDGSPQINEALGQEVALREGIRAVVVPTISGIGSSYFLAAKIRNPVSGVNVRTESIQVRGKDEVLSAVNQLA